MFYGAFDKDTCIVETYIPEGKHQHGTFGHFKNLRDLTLVDLTNVPSMPSIFEPGSRNKRHNIKFLRAFIRDITKPVCKNGLEHIDYVPTQVVSEYLRHILKISGKSLDGIVYQSSRPGGSEACVLFFDSSSCVDRVQGERGEELLLYKVSHKNFGGRNA